MKYDITKFFYSVTVLLFLYSCQNSQSKVNLYPIEKDIKVYQSINPRIIEDFSFLEDIVQDKHIIGIGEATHSTSEIFKLKHKLFKYLVLKHNYRNIIIESSFGEAKRHLDNYIKTGKGDINSFIKNQPQWMLQTEEFYNLIIWIREFNIKNPNDMISIFGMEMQYISDDIKQISDYFTIVSYSEINLNKFKSLKHIWQQLSLKEKEDYSNLYFKLLNAFSENKDLWVSKSSIREFNFVRKHVSLLGQFVNTINQEVDARKHDLRDLYMFENTQWILSFQGQNSRAMIWAHNAHIAQGALNGSADVLGRELKKYYKEGYFSIITDFNKGNFIAQDPTDNWNFKEFKYTNAPEETLTNRLSKIADFVFLNINFKSRIFKEKEFLRKAQIRYAGGASKYSPTQEMTTVDLSQYCDAIFFINEINTAKKLK